MTVEVRAIYRLHQYYDENQEPVKHFKEKVQASRICQFWSSESDLSAKITAALYNEFERNPRPGWSRSKETERDNLIKQAQLCREISPDADWLTKQKQYNKALKYYDEALKIDPKCIVAQREMAGTYFDLGEFANATIHFTRTIEICQTDWNYYCLGVSFYRLEDYRMARNNFSKALMVNTNYTPARNMLAKCDQKLAQPVDPYPTEKL